eukprot:TRINITY_DN71451_c0_g1_i1.p2 TRINITY_DN71451_c0_g1~~TRINITY_DN71451_c0_g1_i1.p2  ORF type:complete len:138 (-),score=21.45 TRINITY_DN71451_c0_g1_i1:94-468(-)
MAAACPRARHRRLRNEVWMGVERQHVMQRCAYIAAAGASLALLAAVSPNMTFAPPRRQLLLGSFGGSVGVLACPGASPALPAARFLKGAPLPKTYFGGDFENFTTSKSGLLSLDLRVGDGAQFF